MIRIFFFSFILSLAFLACKNEPAPPAAAPNPETAATEATPTADKPAKSDFLATEITPAVTWVKPDYIELSDRSIVPLPGQGSDTTVIFLTRHGEKKEGKTSLSPLGGVQATRLANILRDAGIKTFYWSNNTEMQSAFHAASANEAELLNYNARDLDEFIKIILKNDKGSRVAVVGDMISVPEFMNRLLGGGPFPALGMDDYDDLYVIILKGNDVVDIWHAQMYKLQ
ncbi:MAG: hypothetical protein D6714_15105 [Bacteroidetes bacterium]|nr:MAG: hypothetical protein D6714_15105 [Bacteroidota bacterium]